MSGVDLPAGWCLAKISDVAVRGFQRVPVSEETFIYVDIGSIDRENKKITDPQRLNGSDAPSRARKVINKGDVLVSLTRPNLNAVALVPDKYDNQIASTGFEVIKPVVVDSRYIFGLVRSKSFIDAISGKVQGALYPAAKSADVQGFKFPLPPLAEQKIIAAKLDELLAQVDSIKTRLDAIPNILKRFRQSVLAAAVSGKLTEDWRGSQEALEPVECRKGEFSDLERVFERTKSYEIPQEWEWFRLGELGSIAGGGTPRKSEESFWNGEIPWVTPKDMKVSYIESSQVTITEEGVSKSSTKKIVQNSVLFVVRGMILAHSFPVAINLKKVTINQDMKALSPYAGIDSSYLLRALQARRSDFVHLASSSTHGTKRLEPKYFLNIAISIPPLNEQTEIVRRVEQLFAFADQIEQQVKNAQSRVNNLTQSILAKAFRGELTAEWRAKNPELISGENSAEALLARIKAERAAMQPVKQKRARQVRVKPRKAG
ncbi:MAG: restriction endonuclease subunit S [Gammaproteobacteria bacterium]